MRRNIRIEIRNYLLVFLLIANSGMPFFTNEPNILLGSLFLTLPFLNYKHIIQNKFYFLTISLLIILIIGQSLTIGTTFLRATITLIIRWTYPLLVLLVVKSQFPKYFVNLLYGLSIFSLILFIPSIFFSNFDQFLLRIATVFQQESASGFYNYNQNILIYTIKPVFAIDELESFKRNSGPFWEPGGYGVYLNLALLLSISIDKQLLTKKNIIFLISIISTWSTASFIAIGIMLFFYGLFIERKKRYQIILIPLIIVIGSISAYNTLPFISERIDRSIAQFNERTEIGDTSRDRMASAVVDMKTFRNYPIFGTGRSPEARFGVLEKTYLEHRNNGITDFLVKYGLFFFLYYFITIFRGFKNMYTWLGVNKQISYAYLSLLIILILGFSQSIFQSSIFISFYFLHTIFPIQNHRRFFNQSHTNNSHI